MKQNNLGKTKFVPKFVLKYTGNLTYTFFQIHNNYFIINLLKLNIISRSFISLIVNMFPRYYTPMAYRLKVVSKVKMKFRLQKFTLQFPLSRNINEE